jgi:SPOR domain
MRRIGLKAILVLAAVSSMPLAAWSASLQESMRLAWLDGPTWYAIAGSFRTEREAEAMARRLGDRWIAQNSNICVNYTQGLWMVAAGAYSAEDANALAADVKGAYTKECK